MREDPNEDLLVIREDALEKDAEGHPQRAFIWGKALADAKRAEKEAKNKLKLVAAAIEMEFRADPEKYGCEKVTEKLVEAVVAISPQYQEHQGYLLECEHDVDILSAFVYALRDRKDMISDLVQLLLGSYWSKPNVSKPEREAVMTEVEKKTKSRGRNTMRD